MQSSLNNFKQPFHAAMLPNQMGEDVVLDFQIGIINYPKYGTPTSVSRIIQLVMYQNNIIFAEDKPFFFSIKQNNVACC